MIEEKVVEYKLSIKSVLNRNSTRGASEYRRCIHIQDEHEAET